jgi:hypothetical protein
MRRAIRRSRTKSSRVKSSPFGAGPSRVVHEDDRSDADSEPGDLTLAVMQAIQEEEAKKKRKGKGKNKVPEDPEKSKKHNRGARSWNIHEQRLQLRRKLGRPLTHVCYTQGSIQSQLTFLSG